MKIYAVPEDVLVRLISFTAEVPDCANCEESAASDPVECGANPWDDCCPMTTELLCAECGAGGSLKLEDHEGCNLLPFLRGLLEV